MRVEISVDPFLGSSKCCDEDAYWSRDASHRPRDINRILFCGLVLKNCLVEMLLNRFIFKLSVLFFGSFNEFVPSFCYW